MRTAEDIKKELEEVDHSEMDVKVIYQHISLMTRVQLEVLLDIRELLLAQDTRPTVTHPRSPAPPEVTP